MDGASHSPAWAAQAALSPSRTIDIADEAVYYSSYPLPWAKREGTVRTALLRRIVGPVYSTRRICQRASANMQRT